MPISRESAMAVAATLSEALPYIQRFTSRIVVVKLGGNAMRDPALQASCARDIVLMKLVGINPVIVHGGGPQIDEMLKSLGIEPKFIGGLRVTDSRTMDIVEMMLGGLINKRWVTQINQAGGKAIGLTGKDGGLIRAERLTEMPGQPGGDASMNAVDIGQVGVVRQVNTALIDMLAADHFIPVIAPIGAGADGASYNINADAVAGALAVALGAEKLLLLTDVEGIRDRDGNLLARLDRDALEHHIADGALQAGMLPKASHALDAVMQGVRSVHIIDGRVPHAALLEIFTDQGIGTMIAMRATGDDEAADT